MSMTNQTVFKRYETKYLLSKEQKSSVTDAMSVFMQLDKYGRSEIRNLYYDTDTYLLVRRSIEKPIYKEKLRLRSYGKASSDSTVFAELKKKYKSVVYKRRISLPYCEAQTWLAGEKKCVKSTQISSEIDYFLSYYQTLRPRAFLSYEREAYYCEDISDFRVTFDENVLARTDDLSLCSNAYGTELLPQGTSLMEIKCSGGMPLWMTEVLTREKIFKTSFSKYGTAYKELILPHLNQFHVNNKELMYYD